MSMRSFNISRSSPTTLVSSRIDLNADPCWDVHVSMHHTTPMENVDNDDSDEENEADNDSESEDEDEDLSDCSA